MLLRPWGRRNLQNYERRGGGGETHRKQKYYTMYIIVFINQCMWWIVISHLLSSDWNRSNVTFIPGLTEHIEKEKVK